MRLLTMVWTVAVLLIGLAILWMSVLIVMRLFSERRQAHRAQNRAAIDAAFVDILQSQGDARSSLWPFRNDPLLMAESLLALLAMVRGGDLDLVLGALRRAGIDRVLRDCAISGVGPSRLACVEALGALPGPATHDVLSQAARRGGQRVRLAALVSLLQAGGEVSAARVLNHIERKQLPVSGRLAELLEMVVTADPDGGIAALERPEVSSRVRVMLIEAVSSVASAKASAVLISLTRSPQAEIRAAAIIALGKSAPPDLGLALLGAVRDPDWRVRCAAAQANCDGSLAGFVDALMLLQMDGVWLVRFTAQSTLARLGIAIEHSAPAILLGAPAAQAQAASVRA